MFQLSKRSRGRLEGIDERLIDVIDLALTISKVDFGIPEYGGLRTAPEQHSLFQTGRSKKDGYEKKSYHQTGKAFDVYAYVDGRASWEEKDLAMVATSILQAANSLGYVVEWGGLWRRFVDMPHFQIRD